MATITTVSHANARGWAPDLSAFPAIEVIPEALVLQTSTVAGEIEGDQPVIPVIYIDDANAGFIPEGSLLTPDDPGLAVVPVASGKVGQLVKISREQWIQDGAADQLSYSVRRAVTKAANIAYLGQPAPTPPQISPAAGLLNVAGITEAADEITTNLDPLVDLFAALESAGADPTHIVLDPIGWAALRKLKTATDSNAALLGVGTTDTSRRLLDVPVLVTPAMPANTGLVIDKTAVVSAVGQLLVATSEHTFFDSDAVALRCTFRFGQNVVKPERLGTFSVAVA